MTSAELNMERESKGGNGNKGYKPSRALFFVMLAMIVVALGGFLLIGPLKGGITGGGRGTSKLTSAPAVQR